MTTFNFFCILGIVAFFGTFVPLACWWDKLTKQAWFPTLYPKDDPVFTEIDEEES